MRTLLTPRWLLVHVGVVVLVAAFLALGWWQLTRAANGNLLSFGYAVEWPAFAGFVIFMWVKEMRAARRRESGEAAPLPAPLPAREREASRPRRVTRQDPRSGPAYDDSDDGDLAAYNQYLAWLNANPGASPASYPGPTVPSKEDR